MTTDSRQTAEIVPSVPPYAAIPEPGKRVSAVLAVVVHVVLLAFLIYGIRWQTRMPEAVEVELVRSVPVQQARPLAATAEVSPPPPPAPKPEPRPLPAPVKPDIAIKSPEKERPLAKPPLKPEAAKPAVDPFKSALEQELRQTAERKAAVSAKAASAAAEQELAQLRDAQNSAARNKAKAGYIDKIRGKIKGNLVLPLDIKGNPEARFDVVQLPSGEIISVTLKQSSGNNAYDAAVERAIRRSSPLPKPEQNELFERALDLRFRPLED